MAHCCSLGAQHDVQSCRCEDAAPQDAARPARRAPETRCEDSLETPTGPQTRRQPEAAGPMATGPMATAGPLAGAG